MGTSVPALPLCIRDSTQCGRYFSEMDQNSNEEVSLQRGTRIQKEWLILTRQLFLAFISVIFTQR